MLKSARTETDSLPAAGWQVTLSPTLAVRKPFLTALAIFCGLFVLAVVLQILNGAFHSEFNAYPDEPAHYVTSLMVREYITGPHPLTPLRFAKQYYNHYPKVAFGHWPPVFYIVQALWMLLFSPARAAVRLEVAFTTALLAFSVWRVFRRSFGMAASLLAAVLLVCLPLVQESTDEEMAETLLVLFCFWSAAAFARYLRSAKRTDSLWFGLYVSLAVLTKGSGWLLVLIPPMALLLTRKLGLLLRASFWYGPALIAFLCLPWQLVTLHSAERGWMGGTEPSVGYTLHALAQFGSVTVGIVGPVLSVLVALGMYARVWRPLRAGAVSPLPAVLLALLVADWLFHSLVPAGVEDRKMIIAVPAVLYFLVAGVRWLADRLPTGAHFSRWRRTAVATGAALVFATTAFSIPGSDHYGYDQAAAFILSQSNARHATFLVCSDSTGEGLLISEVAMRQPRPETTILRGTKELAHMDWTGKHYQSRFHTPSELLTFLEQQHVSQVVTDTYSGPSSFPHQKLMRETIEQESSHFQLAAQFPGEANSRRGKVEVYSLIP